MVPDSTPLTQCRVLYIGSAVPMETAAGLEAIQKPLLERYQLDPEKDIEGIDAHLTITQNEISMQYVDSPEMVIQFPISSLTMCAAVRCVDTVNAATGETGPRFVSLNDPLAGGPNSIRPAIYTTITRRTQGRRLLECHGFICSSAKDAMELVKCTQRAGEEYKRRGALQPQKPRPASGVSSVPFQTSDFNQTSTMTRSVVNGTQINQEAEMRLIPGEEIQQNIKAGPEFFEPVSKQGYFYSSNQTEVKKYNVHKIHNEENKENVQVRAPEPTPQVANGYGPTVIRVGAPPPQHIERPPPRMHYIPARPPPPPMGHPMYYGAPPPPPPIVVRPRFFSPPPPRARPMPYMMPPPGPIYAPPLYVRRHRSASRSGSRSSSRGSRSKSPKQATGATEYTVPLVVPNGDADSSSEGTLTRRPKTPPTDYGKKPSGQRMSRRDQYEYRYHQEPQYPPMDDVPPQFMYDYYVYPPRHGGYEPFMMYNPHARSRSMPPRGRSSSPHKKGKKKHRKVKKKSKHAKPAKRHDQGRYGFSPRSDISTDSHTGYHSEIPARTRNPLDTNTGYQFYPPRDFRRNENQFMNERNFSKSILEETRRSRDSKSYPTAYELNDQLGKSTRNEDADFTMY